MGLSGYTYSGYTYYGYTYSTLAIRTLLTTAIPTRLWPYLPWLHLLVAAHDRARGDCAYREEDVVDGRDHRCVERVECLHAIER